MAVNFTKFNDTWALRSDLPLSPNTQVTVTKANGDTKPAVVGDLLASHNGRFGGYIYAIQAAPRAASPAPAAVGNLDGVLALFAKAKTHLKSPAILLALGGGDIRLSVAGPQSKAPGTIEVKSVEYTGTHPEAGYPTRSWFGRVTLDGIFEPARSVNAGYVSEIVAKLQELAKEPAKVAAEYGRLSGYCCFCNKRLGEGKDRRSVAVGYGPDCADHFGLPWGEVEHSFTCDEGRAA